MWNFSLIDDQYRTETACGQQVGQNDNSFVIPAKAGIHACRRQACLLQAGSGVAGNSAGFVGMRYSDGHSRLCGNVLYQPLDSSFRWNDDGVSFWLYIIPACLPQTGSCYFLHTQSTCDLTHSELKRALLLLCLSLSVILAGPRRAGPGLSFPQKILSGHPDAEQRRARAREQQEVVVELQQGHYRYQI